MTHSPRQHMKDAPTRRPTTPTALRVGPADDTYEREADRAADAVVRGCLAPWINTLPGEGGVRRKCDACAKEDEEALRRDAVSGDAGGWSAPPIVSDVLRSPGRPLEAGLRAEMERGFGHDFSRVRVHDDAAAAASALAVQAHAYSVGDEIVFAAGRYAPASGEGRRLVAHELAHVVQHRGGRGGRRDGAPTLRRQPAAVPMAPPIGAGATWGQFWRVVVRRFALRGAAAAGVAAADGPLPIGDLIALGLTIWMIWDLIRLWNELWREASTLPRSRNCPPCPAPPPPDIHRVPPHEPHFPCPADHYHWFRYNQNPQTCQCFLQRKTECCLGLPGAPC
ncbi:MAG: DUF4157 domain-containing protein [Polyangiales bacterium]